MKRKDVEVKYTWDIANYFKDQKEIEDLKAELNRSVKAIVSFKGKILDSVDNLYNVLDLENYVSMKLSTLYVYYAHILDQDHTNAKAQSDVLSITNFYYSISAKLSFIVPEILDGDTENLKSYIEDDRLKDFKKGLIELLDQKQYTLSEKEEKIMAQSGSIRSSASEIYSTLTNADMKFENVLDGEGNSLVMNESNWAIYSHSYDRKLRENAFNMLNDTYGLFDRTITSIFINHLKSVKFSVDVRGYKSPRQMALFNNQVDEEIYDNLIKSVNKNLNINHEYIKLRKEKLGVKQLHLYDVYVPIVEDVEGVYSYQTAKQLVVDSLAPLGDEYANNIKLALDNRCVDVYPNEGKRSGAYSGGSYETKPYILLNYTDTLNDVFTLIHELGHSMQTKYTNENQTFQDSHYKIFVAEIASTVNELLLFEHMKKQNISDDIKAYLINYNLDQFRSTVYRQTMFGEFEYEASKLVFDDKEVNNEILGELYLKINKSYFGKHMNVDDNIKYEWLRIPHFYYDFYVYQYATCFCIATKVVSEIINGNTKMVDNYLEFLKLGDSVKPIDLIKTLDIDITKSQTIDDALNIYAKNLEELKELLK
ncbi:MAG: oligoendopeptidase F [Mycoplasmatales bacterium]